MSPAMLRKLNDFASTTVAEASRLRRKVLEGKNHSGRRKEVRASLRILLSAAADLERVTRKRS